MKKKLRPLSAELIFTPFHGGIKFMRPDENLMGKPTFADLMQLSSDVCLITRDVRAVYMNEPSIIRTGMASLKDCLDKTINDVAKPETAYIVTQQQQKIFKQKSLQIMEYDFMRHDDLVHHCLLFSMPWYQENSELGGILDLAIVSQRDSIPVAMANMVKLGLLNQPNYANTVDDLYQQLSKREKQCVNLLSEGKKSKQIGLELDLSPRTVDHYLESCMTKFGVSTRYELVSKYMQIKIR